MNKTTKLTIALSCIGLLAGLAACTTPNKGAKDTIEEWVKKDIRQYYQVDVALSKPLEIDYATDLGEELRQHEAESVVLYKTTAFQFAYEDIIDEWISVVWIKTGSSAKYAAEDLEIDSANYSRFYR